MVYWVIICVWYLSLSRFSAMSDIDDVKIMTPGEVIVPDASTFLVGHGTYVGDKGELIASVCGVVEKVDKLITVVPLHSRYVARTGDVVVGRIVDVKPKNWTVDVNGRTYATLMLNSVNLPYGELRRRKDDDALNMRSMLEEMDIFSAEVLEVRTDGGCQLHTRSLKYGKLANGQLVVVQPSLVKRIRQHFVSLDVGVDLIIGCNGYIWVSTTGTQQKAYDPSTAAAYDPLEAAETADKEAAEAAAKENDEGTESEEEPDEEAQNLMKDFAKKHHNPNNPLAHDAYVAKYIPAPREKRLICARVVNSIAVLNKAYIAIYPTTIMDVYEASLATNLAAPDMLLPSNVGALTATALQRKGRGK